MRICVTSEGHRFTIPIPNWLVFNTAMSHFGAKIISRHMDEPITAAQFRRLCQGIREARGNFPGLPLVDIRETGGDSVVITL